jgi:hypothetical protein
MISQVVYKFHNPVHVAYLSASPFELTADTRGLTADFSQQNLFYILWSQNYNAFRNCFQDGLAFASVEKPRSIEAPATKYAGTTIPFNCRLSDDYNSHHLRAKAIINPRL